MPKRWEWIDPAKDTGYWKTEPPASQWAPSGDAPSRKGGEDNLWEKYEAMMREQVWGGIQPQPRYRPAFYEQLGGLEGTQYHTDWFERMFPSLIARFESQLPTYKGFRSAEFAAEEAKEIERDWSRWLKRKEPELREQWWSLAPEQRGERPWAFQPRIATMSF